jgi:hypothetical protein
LREEYRFTADRLLLSAYLNQRASAQNAAQLYP